MKCVGIQDVCEFQRTVCKDAVTQTTRLEILALPGRVTETVCLFMGEKSCAPCHTHTRARVRELDTEIDIEIARLAETTHKTCSRTMSNDAYVTAVAKHLATIIRRVTRKQTKLFLRWKTKKAAGHNTGHNTGHKTVTLQESRVISVAVQVNFPDQDGNSSFVVFRCLPSCVEERNAIVLGPYWRNNQLCKRAEAIRTCFTELIDAHVRSGILCAAPQEEVEGSESLSSESAGETTTPPNSAKGQINLRYVTSLIDGLLQLEVSTNFDVDQDWALSRLMRAILQFAPEQSVFGPKGRNAGTNSNNGCIWRLGFEIEGSATDEAHLQGTATDEFTAPGGLDGLDECSPHSRKLQSVEYLDPTLPSAELQPLWNLGPFVGCSPNNGQVKWQLIPAKAEEGFPKLVCMISPFPVPR